MPVIVNKLQIDGQQAIDQLAKIQSKFVDYNGALGSVVSQTGNFIREGKKAFTTLTQIDSEGRKVTTVLKAKGNAYEVVAVKVGIATERQRRLSAELERQRNLADALAKTIRNTPAGVPNLTPVAPPGAVDPRLVGQSVSSLALLSRAQVEVAAKSNGLNAAQTRAFISVVEGAGRARAAIATLGRGVDFLKGKFVEAGRIAFATAIYRGISLIQLGLQEGARSAIDFSKNIGLIRTLTKDSGESFETWASSIRKVADELGLPVNEVATATYEAISSQVVKTTKDFDFLRTAFGLAKIANSDVVSSTNILTAVINSLGIAESNAGRIADQLFTTIDLGNVKLSEYAQTIGRSLSLNKTAAGTFEELNASIIVLTQSGVNAAEAGTLVNNVYSQLIKPNEALEEQFRKLGFATGEEAVATLGFVGVLRELDKAAKGAREGIATFFPELRGLRGVTGLLNPGLGKFDEALDKIRNSSGRAAEALAELRNASGVQLQEEINRIKNFFTVDFGAGILSTLASITSRFGGIVQVAKTLGNTFVTLGAAAAAFFLVLKADAAITGIINLAAGFRQVNATLTVSKSLAVAFGSSIKDLIAANTTLLAGGAFVAGFLAVSAILDRQRAAAQARIEEIKREADQRVAIEIAADRRISEGRINEANRAYERLKNIYGTFIAAVRRANDQALDDAREHSARVAEDLKNSIEVILGVLRKSISDLRGISEQADQNIKTLQDARFHQSIEADREKFEEYVSNVVKSANAAANAVGAAGPGQQQRVNLGGYADELQRVYDQRNKLLLQKADEAFKLGNIQEGIRLFKEALSNISSLQSHLAQLNQASGGLGLTNVAGAAAKLYQEFDAATRRAEATQEAIKKKSEEQLLVEEAKVKAVKDRLDAVVEFTQKGVFNKEGGLRVEFGDDPRKAITELRKRQQEAIDEIKRTQAASSPEFAARLGATLGDLTTKFKAQEDALVEQLGRTLADQQILKNSKALLENLENQRKEHEKILGLLQQEAEAIKKQSGNIETLTGAAKEGLQNPTGILDRIGVANPIKNSVDALLTQLNALSAGGLEKNLDEADRIFKKLDQIVGSRGPIAELSAKNPVTGADTTLAELVRSIGEQLRLTHLAQENKTAFDAQLRSLIDSFRNFRKELLGEIGQAVPEFDKLTLPPSVVEGFKAGIREEITAVEELKRAYDALIETKNKALGGVPKPPTIGPQTFTAPQPPTPQTQLVATNSPTPTVTTTQGQGVTNNNTVTINVQVDGNDPRAAASKIAAMIRRGVSQGTLAIS